MNVLLVDDNAAVRAITREMLEDGGHQVTEAGGLEQALERARGLAELDVIVTDLVMPDGDGLDVAASLSLLFPYARVLFTSAYANLEWTGHFVAKPYTSEEFLRALDGLALAS